MQGLASATAPVEPFALQAQYVASMAKAEAEADQEVSDDESKKLSPETKTDKSKGVKNKADWGYKAVRDEFINQKKADGFTYAKCESLWDESSEKASFLGMVSLQELKKRKFVPKGATSNPWAAKPNGDK